MRLSKTVQNSNKYKPRMVKKKRCVMDSKVLSHYSPHFNILSIECNYILSTGFLLEPLNNGCQQTLNGLAQELAFDLLRSKKDNV